MTVLIFLMMGPLVVALGIWGIKHEKLRDMIIRGSCLIMMAVAVVLAMHYFNRPNAYYLIHSEMINQVILGTEVLLAIYIIYIGVKNKKYGVASLSFIQTLIMVVFERTRGSAERFIEHHLFVDKLTVIMIMLIAVIGGLIVIYAVGYMREYHLKHKEVKDQRRRFFAVFFAFLMAMFGIVLSNDLIWIYFFWEITTLCSFLLIGYTQSQQAKKNAFLALFLNLIGGLCFALGIVYLGYKVGTTELKVILNQSLGGMSLVIPALLLAIAALAKSAQLPFSKWLLGAMVAPTPVSALLHSATMVKAGVYLLIRISPLLVGNLAGMMVILIGSISFLIMSILAITQSDAKKILAYSTIANLGLIVACTGVGSYEAIWAALLLIIFHGTSKSLLFLTVGATEQLTGSRDVEDMHGLIVKLPEMALFMAIGIAGMFLAPFGMLVSKWAVLKAFVDSKNVIIILFLVYGSAATLFYWTKWLGKLGAILPKGARLRCNLKLDEWVALVPLASATIAFCILFPAISDYLIEPFLHDMFSVAGVEIISIGNQHIMTIMLAMIIILPFGMTQLTSKVEKLVPVYMSGINQGDNRSFESAMGEPKKMYISSWYMNEWIKEKKWLQIGIIIAVAIIVLALALALGGALK